MTLDADVRIHLFRDSTPYFRESQPSAIEIDKSPLISPTGRVTTGRKDDKEGEWEH